MPRPTGNSVASSPPPVGGRDGSGRVPGAEQRRLDEDTRREKNWKRWGPYLSERQWGTVREDYSPDGDCWNYFTHEQSRSRAYRWGEDGILGITDRECRLCFALSMWNEKDPILKERLFGLTGPEGNHGEDCKEEYFYLDSTPTHSYMKGLYKYPQAEFPYQRLVDENRARTREQPEFELSDTGVFDESRYFDVQVEYAKDGGRGPDDVLIRITVFNRGDKAAPIHLLPTLWFRNTWVWGATHEGSWERPWLGMHADGSVLVHHESLGTFRLWAGLGPGGDKPDYLFTDNETNLKRLWGAPNERPFVKDAFHDAVVEGRAEAVNPARMGTKAAVHYRFTVPAHGKVVLRLRLCADDPAPGAPFDRFDATFDERIREADEFYAAVLGPLDAEHAPIGA